MADHIQYITPVKVSYFPVHSRKVQYFPVLVDSPVGIPIDPEASTSFKLLNNDYAMRIHMVLSG